MVITGDQLSGATEGAGEIIPLPRLFATPPVWEANIGTGLNQSDDDCDFRSFGFTFEFYGVTYTGVWINSNGNLTFHRCNRDWWDPDIPDGSNVIIGPLYGDFNPSVAGDVFYNTLADDDDDDEDDSVWFRVASDSEGQGRSGRSALGTRPLFSNEAAHVRS